MSGLPYEVQIQMNAPVVEPKHVVTKEFLEDYVAGKVKSPVRVISTSNLIGTYSSATKAITATANGALNIDGVSLAIDDRILVAGQTDKTQNGIYVVTNTGNASAPFIIKRAADFDSSNEIYPSVRIGIMEGTSNHDTEWKLATDAPIVLDSTSLEFIKDTGSSGIVEQVFDIVGNASATSYPLSHNWGTKNVTTEIFNKFTGETTIFDVVRTSINDVTINCALPLGVGNDYVAILRAYLQS